MTQEEALVYWDNRREVAELEYGELCPQGSEGLEGPGTDCGNCGASHLRSGGLCPICFERLAVLREKVAPLSSCACGEPLARGWLLDDRDWCDGDTGMRHIPLYTSDNRPNDCKAVIILDEPQEEGRDG